MGVLLYVGWTMGCAMCVLGAVEAFQKAFGLEGQFGFDTQVEALGVLLIVATVATVGTCTRRRPHQTSVGGATRVWLHGRGPSFCLGAGSVGGAEGRCADTRGRGVGCAQGLVPCTRRPAYSWAWSC